MKKPRGGKPPVKTGPPVKPGQPVKTGPQSPKTRGRVARPAGLNDDEAALFSALENMDESELRAFLDSVRKAAEGDDDDFEDAEEAFADFLDLCAPGAEGADEKEEAAAELTGLLAQVKVDSNGGKREAREQIAAILETLGDAIERRELAGADLMLTAKVLADAGWEVPERLKQAVVESLNDHQEGGDADAAGQDLTASLIELARQVDNDEFALAEQLISLLAALPNELCAQLIAQIAKESGGTLDRTLVGFALHADAAIADAALDALAATSSRPVESVVVERLVRIRPWLIAERQANVDAAVKTLRPLAGPPVKAETAQLLKAYLSSADGAGGHNAMVTTKVGKRYAALAVLIKPEGVADVIVIDDQTKAELDSFVVHIKSTTPTAETDLDGFARMLSLALADNLASGHPPPYHLVQLSERTGLGPLTPRTENPAAIADELLAGLPEEATSPAATLRAHQRLAESELASHWFEAGPHIDELLFPTKTKKQRVSKLLADHFPQRKAYWAKVAAVSALALKGPPGGRPAPYFLELALVARDLASDKPVDKLPILAAIADMTAMAFASQR